MARRKSSGLVLIGVMLVGAVLWWIDNREVLEETLHPENVPREGGTLGDYRVLENCALVGHRNNDGDSFHVRVPGGETQEFRLYFVDAPESAFKTYRDGNTNGKRLRHQAEYFGKLSQDQTTAVGQAAKKWTAGVLGGGRFTVYTRDEKVYSGPRLYAFVEVEEGGRKRWLHELLVEQGLARIYTQGAALPDGTSVAVRKRVLRGVEQVAKKAGKGGWR